MICTPKVSNFWGALHVTHGFFIYFIDDFIKNILLFFHIINLTYSIVSYTTSFRCMGDN